MDALFAYFSEMLSRWYWTATNIPFGLEKILQTYDKEAYERFIAPKISSRLRKIVFVASALSGFALANFAAFREQFEKAKTAQATELCPAYDALSNDQHDILRDRFKNTNAVISMGACGDRSAHILAQQIASAISDSKSAKATVYADGELDRIDESGIEVGVRNHLQPSQTDKQLIEKIVSSGLPVSVIEMNQDVAASGASLYIFVAPKGDKCRT